MLALKDADAHHGNNVVATGVKRLRCRASRRETRLVLSDDLLDDRLLNRVTVSGVPCDV